MDIHPRIYERLKEVARQGGLVLYSEIAPMASLNMESQADRNKLGEILGTISAFENSQDRPMLSALVVHADDQMPGRGFFNLARELGLLHGRDDLTELDFFAKEVKKVHSYWSNR